MKKGKLSLGSLKVKSFVTSVNDGSVNNGNDVNGGAPPTQQQFCGSGVSDSCELPGCTPTSVNFSYGPGCAPQTGVTTLNNLYCSDLNACSDVLACTNCAGGGTTGVDC